MVVTLLEIARASIPLVVKEVVVVVVRLHRHPFSSEAEVGAGRIRRLRQLVGEAAAAGVQRRRRIQ